ncbi:MAG: tRNA guanosine(34) transglycosylase Tgt [Acidobacteria bacterium]|nr:tRNA guanosine(34) transglycosylase Tgt [Acidobacteriota bacterium]
MSFSFQLLQTDTTGARLGRLTTPHGAIDTPCFMPVGTAATVKGLTQDVLESLGVQILLANTYHLFLRPGHELIRSLGGLHKFMAWPRAILTDSGGYQVFSLADLRKIADDGVTFRSHLDGAEYFLSPETAAEIQIALGADIFMVLDECIETPASRDAAARAAARTFAWARRSREYFSAHGDATRQAQLGIVQGATFDDLRRESADQIVSLDFPGYAIGGLAVGEPHEVTCAMTAEVTARLPNEKPRYLMGVGYPEQLADYISRGVDMMDCVLPTRSARNGLLFTSAGRLNIRNARFAADPLPPDENCACMVCRRYSRAYLRHLVQANEILAAILATHHNVFFYLDLMRRIRAAIASGSFSSFASQLTAQLSSLAE